MNVTPCIVQFRPQRRVRCCIFAPMTITFRPLSMDDMPLLRDWLMRPHVVAWWGEQGTAAEIEAEYGALTDERSATRGYIALLDDAPIGFIQSYVALGSGDGWWTDERDPGVRGIDQFLASEAQLGRGLGSEMVRAFVAELFRDPAVTRIQTDPSPDNGRAVRCYEKAGFRAVGEVETPDGRALLMICER
jgi:RimJ/RimL family protein N-acetyltransferase